MKFTRSSFIGTGRRFGSAAGALAIGCLAVSSAAAQQVVWQYGATAGAVNEVSIANLPNTNLVVTAVRNGGNRLELISWDNSGRSLVRKGSITAGEIFSVSMVDLSATRVLTAVINGGGYVELIAWEVSAAGKITRLGSVVGETASPVAVTALNPRQVVTAYANSAGNLIVAAWGVSSTGAITQQGSAIGEAVFELSIGTVSARQVMVGAQNAAGNLVVESLAVTPIGVVTFQGENSAGEIFLLAGSGATTAVINGGGLLEMIVWSVNSNGTISRLMSGTAETAFSVAVWDNITVAVDASSLINVGEWENVPPYGQVASAANDLAGPSLAIAPLTGGANAVVTASVNGSGDLELNVWTYM